MSATFVSGATAAVNPFPANSNGPGAFSIAVRFQVSDLTTFHQFAGIGWTGGCVAEVFFDNADVKWGCTLSDDAQASFDEPEDSTNTPAINTWVHLVQTWDGTSHKLYTNGALVSTTTPVGFTRTGTIASITAPVLLVGSVQDVMFYGRTVTAAEVLSLARARFPPPSPIGWYYFNSASLADSSGVAGNLIGSGTAPTSGPIAPTSQGQAAGTTNATGAAAVGTARSVAGAGTTQATGAATLAKSASAANSGTTQSTGSATLAATAALVAAGTMRVTGSAASNVGTLAATGSTRSTGAVAMTSKAALAASGLTNVSGLAVFVGGGGGTRVSTYGAGSRPRAVPFSTRRHIRSR